METQGGGTLHHPSTPLTGNVSFCYAGLAKGANAKEHLSWLAKVKHVCLVEQERT